MALRRPLIMRAAVRPTQALFCWTAIYQHAWHTFITAIVLGLTISRLLMAAKEMSCATVDAPGFGPARSDNDHGRLWPRWPRLKPAFPGELSARLKPCPSTLTSGHYFCSHPWPTARSLHHTRQAFSRTIGWPGLQPNASWNPAEFCTTPLTRQRPGECGSMIASLRAS